MTLFVRVTRCPEEPLLVGQPAAVVGQDWVPTNGTSEANPLLDLLFASGHRASVRAREVELICDA